PVLSGPDGAFQTVLYLPVRQHVGWPSRSYGCRLRIADILTAVMNLPTRADVDHAMTTRPDLSVIIPMHNASATVTGVVESFLGIDASGVEVVVIDAASTDDSVARVTALGRPEVIVERFETNRGAGIARNRGFERATGRYTLFFDADDEIHPLTLTSAIQALDDTGADVAMMPYRYRRGHSPQSDAM